MGEIKSPPEYTLSPTPSSSEKPLPCTHHLAPTTTSAYPHLHRLLQSPSSRTQIQSLITNLQRILDEDKCTACAIEDTVGDVTRGALEAKKARKEGKRMGGGWKGSGKGDGEGVWSKETVWGVKKEVKGLAKGVKAEWKEGKRGV